MLAVPFASVVAGPRLDVSLVDPTAQAIVSGVPDDEAFRTAIANALGFALPVEPNRMVGGLTRALWVAPWQWLIASDDPIAGTLTARLIEAVYLGGGFVSCMRDGFAVFELSGAVVRQILAMGCALDFDDDALAPGRCARTVFAGVNAILYPLGSLECWRLHVERALARHLMEWLQKAATAIG
jgi:sarcosine oxidase subunit gamma